MCRPSTALLFPLLITCLACVSCTPLPKESNAASGDLASLDSLPAAYGELVNVTVAPQRDGATGWRELWFQNEATGQVTYVPALLPDWNYNPKLVRTFDRPGWVTPTEATP
jgi:hypothetical protein